MLSNPKVVGLVGDGAGWWWGWLAVGLVGGGSHTDSVLVGP